MRRFFKAASRGNLGLVEVVLAPNSPEEQHDQLKKYQESCLFRRRLIILLHAKGIQAVRAAERIETERLQKLNSVNQFASAS